MIWFETIKRNPLYFWYTIKHKKFHNWSIFFSHLIFESKKDKSRRRINEICNLRAKTKKIFLLNNKFLEQIFLHFHHSNYKTLRTYIIWYNIITYVWAITYSSILCRIMEAHLVKFNMRDSLFQAFLMYGSVCEYLSVCVVIAQISAISHVTNTIIRYIILHHTFFQKVYLKVL